MAATNRDPKRLVEALTAPDIKVTGEFDPADTTVPAYPFDVPGLQTPTASPDATGGAAYAGPEDGLPPWMDFSNPYNSMFMRGRQVRGDGFFAGTPAQTNPAVTSLVNALIPQELWDQHVRTGQNSHTYHFGDRPSWAEWGDIVRRGDGGNDGGNDGPADL